MTDKQFNRINKNAKVINGIDVVFIPLHNKAYAFEIDGGRWVFVNSNLQAKERNWLVKWGLEFTGEMGVQK